jgi:hypothetical protein
MIQLKDFSLLFLLLLSAATYSQNKIVGTITDSNGKTLPGVEFFNKTSNTKVFTYTRLLCNRLKQNRSLTSFFFKEGYN